MFIFLLYCALPDCENYGLNILYLKLFCAQETGTLQATTVYRSPTAISFTLLIQANIRDYLIQSE